MTGRPAESAEPAAVELRVRELCAGDLDGVARIDALHTGESKSDYWQDVFRNFLSADRRPVRIGLAVEADGRILGYLLGEVRAFEFNSEACGWIFSAGVDPGRLRQRVASGLLTEACRRFREAGIKTVRTMVKRNDVPVLSFFRANGFVGGSLVQLELDLEGDA